MIRIIAWLFPGLFRWRAQVIVPAIQPSWSPEELARIRLHADAARRPR